jgi:hypothetical protein
MDAPADIPVLAGLELLFTCFDPAAPAAQRQQLLDILTGKDIADA